VIVDLDQPMIGQADARGEIGAAVSCQLAGRKLGAADRIADRQSTPRRQAIVRSFQAIEAKSRGTDGLWRGRRLRNGGVAADDNPEGNCENKKKNKQ
jgi:hypothetical protein